MQRSDANMRRVVRHVLNGEKPQWTGASAEYKPEDPEDFKKPMRGENKMTVTYVQVQYEKAPGVYAGAKYTYRTSLDLRPGDKVIAPTKMNERQKAIVTDTGLIPPSFPCKDINEYDPDAEPEEIV